MFDFTSNITQVLEYMSCGSLDSKLWRFGRFGDETIEIPSWRDRLLWLRDISEAMVYLHDMKNVIHRDLKSQNVLLNYDFKEWFDHPERPKRIRAKVSDFNTSKFCNSLGVARKPFGIVHSRTMREGQDDEEEKTTTNDNDTDRTTSYNTVTSVGTYQYLAPELVNGLESMKDHAFYGAPVDVYSYGCIVYECLELRAPWSHDGRKYTFAHKVLHAVMRGERPPLIRCNKKNLGKIEEQLIDLMNECWHQDPHRRPLFSDVNHTVECIRKENLSSFGSAKMPRRRRGAGKKPRHVLAHHVLATNTQTGDGDFEELEDDESGSGSSLHIRSNDSSASTSSLSDEVELVKIAVS